MEQIFPVLSKSLSTSMALSNLSLSPKEQQLLTDSDKDAQIYFEHIGKCQMGRNVAANTKCVLEAIAQTPKCKGEYMDLVGCAKRLTQSRPDTVQSNLQSCKKPERELARCVDDLVSTLLDTLRGQHSEFVLFDRLERIDDF